MRKHNSIAIVVASLIGISSSCEYVNEGLIDSNDSTGKPSIVTIRASLEQQSGDAQTKTMLGQDNAVLWSQGDAISVLCEGSDPTLLTYADINGMTQGLSKHVMITSVSYNGYKLASSGSAWSTEAISGYSNYGTELSSAKATSNEAQLLQDMKDFYTSKGASAAFNLTKVSSSAYTIQNTSGNYLYGTGTSETSSWSGTSMNLTMENATGTSASSTIVSQSNNPSLLRIRNSSNAPLFSNDNGTPKWYSGQTGGWTLWYMYEITDGNSRFSSNAQTGSATADFSGSYPGSAEKYYAIYPYSEDNIMSNGNIHFSVPAVQHYVEGSFDSGINPSVGVIDNGNVNLKNLFGVIKFTLKSKDDIAVNSIKVEDNDSNSNLWGNVSVACSTIDDGTYTSTVTGGNNAIVLQCGSISLNSDGTDFYIVVPTGAFASGFTITVESPYGAYTKTTTTDNTIRRSRIKEMPILEIKESSLQTVEFLIENDIVHDFVSASYGTYVDFSYSAFSNGGFASRSTTAYSNGIRTDHPAVKTVSWEGSASSYNVTVTDKATYTYTETVGGNSYDISGLAPNVKYYYTISDGSNIVTQGCFKTTGQLRMIRIDETWNVRDLGGWHTNDGKTVKYGKLFRGGHLDNIGTVSQNKLVAAGVKAELDLRGIKSEGGTNYGDGSYAHDDELSLIPNATYKHFYIDASRDNPGTYSGLVQCVAWAIQQSLAGKPVYFHCKTGADRTGQISVLILGLIGVTEQDIEKEYETTNFGYEKNSSGVYERIDRTLPNTYMNYLVPVINACPGDTFQARCRYYLSKKFTDVSISESDMDAFTNLILE